MNTPAKVLLAGAIFLAGAKLQAQTQGRSQADSLNRKYAAMARSTNPDTLQLLQKELYGLLKSKDEKIWNVARNGFYQMKKGSVSDSLQKVMVKKFPNGSTARSAGVGKIYDEKDVLKKEALYKAWLKKFPPENAGSEKIEYDYAKQALATAFAQAGNTPKALQYSDDFYTAPWRGEGFAGVGVFLLRAGDTTAALPLFKKAIAATEAFLDKRKDEPGAAFAAVGYPGYCMTYAEIMLAQKNYTEALKYLTLAEENSRTTRTGLSAAKARIMKGLGRNLEAFKALETTIAEGQGDDKMKAELKAMYVQLNGTDAGFEKYQADMKKQFLEKLRTQLSKQLIKEPAAPFTLKDASGKQVSLADYKGKVVVLDFWATWCGPCKRSFPAMQVAVDKYAKDENVHFLFVDTWENVADYEAEVNKFITENKYRFHVVFDPRHPETKASAVADAYKVNSIPAKFVIDGNGNIRFKMSGFSGGNDAAVEELSEMIEMARKSS